MNNIIVGMGEALWDVLPEGKKIGGAPANFAYHVSQFGFDSRVVSAVGNDELGDEIMSVFKEKKLNTQIERVDYPTGTVQVTLDAEGVPCYEIKDGVAYGIFFTRIVGEKNIHAYASHQFGYKFCATSFRDAEFGVQFDFNDHISGIYIVIFDVAYNTYTNAISKNRARLGQSVYILKLGIEIA